LTVYHLSPKENYLRAVRFQDPEYVPNGRHLPVEGIGYAGVNPEDNRPPGAKNWSDFWGVRHEKTLEGVMPMPVYHPLEDPARWDAYRWPSPDDPARLGPLMEQARGVDRRERALSVSHRSTLFERAWLLVGMENLLMLMAAEPDRADWVFDHIIAFQLGMARHYLALRPDLVALGDDVGTQRAPLISPAHYRRYIQPRYARLIALYRDAGVLITYHTCGHIMPLVADFLALGIDVLNPVQARANGDLVALRRQTQGRMALHGAVDTQYTLTLGSPGEVRAEVRERIRTLGAEGGYICAPDQDIPMPPENVWAFDGAVAEYGRYPAS
jgi:uroporphyrinogen decarboxylase